MTLSEFKSTYLGKHVDFDHAYGYTCMDLYQQYNKEVVGAPHVPSNAYGVWNNYPKEYYTAIPNTPTNIAPSGSVIIFFPTKNNPYGHIAIVVGADVRTARVIEQDGYTQTVVKYADYKYDNCVGWLIPKSRTIQQPANPTQQEYAEYRKRVNDTINNVIALLKSLQ